LFIENGIIFLIVILAKTDDFCVYNAIASLVAPCRRGDRLQTATSVVYSATVVPLQKNYIVVRRVPRQLAA